MSEAARTEHELEQASIPPSGVATVTPFAELSPLMLVGIDTNQANHLLWTAGWTTLADNGLSTSSIVGDLTPPSAS